MLDNSRDIHPDLRLKGSMSNESNSQYGFREMTEKSLIHLE